MEPVMLVMKESARPQVLLLRELLAQLRFQQEQVMVTPLLQLALPAQVDWQVAVQLPRYHYPLSSC